MTEFFAGIVKWLCGSSAAGGTSPPAGEATRLSPTTSLGTMLVILRNVCSGVVGVSRSGEGAMDSARLHPRPPSNLPPQGGEALPAAPLSFHFRHG